VLVIVAAVLGAVRRYHAGDVTTGSARAHGAVIERYDIRSRFVDQRLPQVLVTPRGAGSGRPLLLFLHGRGSGEESNVNDGFLRALDELGAQAPVVVLPSGGDHSYFHGRSSGDWARYVLDDVIPQAVKRSGADGNRIGIGGISMGGFGAFSIARLRPDRFCAVGGHSAALWSESGATPAGAFDDADDFSRNDVIAIARAQGASAWGNARLWLDGGNDDPFREAGEQFAGALGIKMRHWSGAHEGKYWSAHFDDYLAFYGAALAAC